MDSGGFHLLPFPRDTSSASGFLCHSLNYCRSCNLTCSPQALLTRLFPTCPDHMSTVQPSNVLPPPPLKSPKRVSRLPRRKPSSNIYYHMWQMTLMSFLEHMWRDSLRKRITRARHSGTHLGGRSLSWTAWSTKRVLGQPVLHSKTLSQGKEREEEEEEENEYSFLTCCLLNTTTLRQLKYPTVRRQLMLTHSSKNK